MLGAIGASIPEDTEHAVSVSLPTWKANVGYEEGEEWVLSKMNNGYPRFFIHKSIKKLAQTLLRDYGRAGEDCMLFPSTSLANQCRQFMKKQLPPTHSENDVRIVEFVSLVPRENKLRKDICIWSDLAAVMFPSDMFPLAKQFWQHNGGGVSSRRAEFCRQELEEGLLVEKSTIDGGSKRVAKGPRRYSRQAKDKSTVQSQTRPLSDGQDPSRFVEERFGRNLDLAFVDGAKLAIRRRIAGTLRSNVSLKEAINLSKEGGRPVEGFTEDDVFLFPTGMNAIFNSHQVLMAARGPKKSVCYGFPYIDTLKILEKFGPGCYFYGFGSQEELDELERRLEAGEELLALFCEFPSNPLLVTPDLARISQLASKYDFAVVVDETIGTLLNVHVLPHADIVVSSLTKIFSGDCNVMGGCLTLNPRGRYYSALRTILEKEYEDNYWGEDVVFLERNSRDFVTRVDRINVNAEAVCEVLHSHPRVKQVYYPKYNPTKALYDTYRLPDGGYSGLLSISFYNESDAVVFFDTLETAKGPSLGTNFTLSSPYVLLAHYNELDWAASFGIDTNLVRVSIGLEDTDVLADVFRQALKALE